MFELDRYREHLGRLHDHICPRQILGLRMGELAGEILGLPLPQQDKRLFVFVETDGCFADGVMVATGCSLGHRTLRLQDYGKVAATFVDTQADTGSTLRIWPHPQARKRVSEFVAAAQSRWHAQLEAYQIMPADVLLCASRVQLSAPIRTIISRPGVRVNCDSCGEEIINEREIARQGVTLCRACAGESEYYRTADAPLAPVTSADRAVGAPTPS